MTTVNNEKTAVKKDVSFSSPLSFDLGDNGGTTAFASFAEVARWAQTEIRAWREIIGRDKADYPFVQAVIDTQMHTPQTLYGIAESALDGKTSVAEGMTLIRRGMNTYLTYQCIHSCGVLGRAAAVMYHYEPMLTGLLAGASGSAVLEATKDYPASADAEAFTFGYLMALPFRTAVPTELIDTRLNETSKRVNTLCKRLLPSETALKQMDAEQSVLRRDLDESRRLLGAYKQEAEQCLARLVTEAKRTSEYATNELWNQMNAIQTDHERRLAELRQSVSAHIRYGTALDYWNEQLKDNRNKTNQTVMWFVISGLFAIFTMIMITVGLSKITFLKETPLISAPLFLVIIGVAGVLGYMLFQSKTRYEKAAALAQDKVSLLETLAALETEGKSGDADRDVLLEKIFSTNFPVLATEKKEPSEEEKTPAQE